MNRIPAGGGDAAARELAESIGGRPSVRIRSYGGREVGAIGDRYGCSSSARKAGGRRAEEADSAGTLLIFNVPIRRHDRFRHLPNPGKESPDLFTAPLQISE